MRINDVHNKEAFTDSKILNISCKKCNSINSIFLLYMYLIQYVLQEGLPELFITQRLHLLGGKTKSNIFSVFSVPRLLMLSVQL